MPYRLGFLPHADINLPVRFMLLRLSKSGGLSKDFILRSEELEGATLGEVTVMILYQIKTKRISNFLT